MAYIGFEGDYVELEDTVRDAMLFTIGGTWADGPEGRTSALLLELDHGLRPEQAT